MAGSISPRTIRADGPLGPLGPLFAIEVTEGFSCLVGRNNAGKSAILQLVFRGLLDDPEFGRERVVLVPADRATLPTSLEVGGRSLADYNDNYVSSLRAGTLWPHDGSRGSITAELSRVLLTHTNLIKQVNAVDGYLADLGLPPIVIQGAQQLHFEDVQAHFQGSGLRALLPILAAVSDWRVRAILIDEPEASLEPSVQRRLRDLLIREASRRVLMVATHSHLFVNRGELGSTRVVSRDDEVIVREVADESDHLKLVFDLLGNSTEDLLLPGNFVVVEGGSDETIVERALQLSGARAGSVKVLAADGLSKVEPTAAAIEMALRPIITGDSPYAGSIVVIVDRAIADADKHTTEELRRILGQRLVQLSAASLEEYLPPELYEKAGLVKETELINLAAVKNDYRALQAAKGTLARRIAAAMVEADLDLIPGIRDAVRLASEPTTARSVRVSHPRDRRDD